MAVKVNLSKVQAYFNEKRKIIVKGNVHVDVYMIAIHRAFLT